MWQLGGRENRRSCYNPRVIDNTNSSWVNQQTSVLTKALAGEQERILASVHCGLCLEACPT